MLRQVSFAAWKKVEVRVPGLGRARSGRQRPAHRTGRTKVGRCAVFCSHRRARGVRPLGAQLARPGHSGHGRCHGHGDDNDVLRFSRESGAHTALTATGAPTTTADEMPAQESAPRETIFSGIQPSGELHLGNYLGAIRNWVALQSSYRCFFCIVDYHAITQPFEPNILGQRVREMACDLIACGIDPAKSTLFVQSAVREHTELAWALASVTGYGELGRMTQFKDKAERNPDNINAGLFTYPVLQAADILIYHATKVPVGEDQRQHLELAREIVRKWNARFGETFREPEALYSSTPKILGLDGQAKMSKSLGNTISLREDDTAVWNKLRTAATDPARVRRTDVGDPDKCNVFTLHKFFSTEERQAEVRQGCTTAGIGCIECKKWLLEGVKADLDRIRARRDELLAKPEAIDEILADGARRARAVAAQTMALVRDRLGIDRLPGSQP
jgi:tryptophanyl-tRNA synthetase